LRSKYKRSVIGWGWSMINPLANMLVYTIVFAYLFRIKPPLGVPSGLNSYALMYLSAMLPWMMFQGSVMESMGALLGNQNLIQKTFFPRELIPGATVASKLVSHFIEMSLLLTAVVCVGNWRALVFLPGIIAAIAVVTVFALGLSLLFSIGNVFYRDIQHFSLILFFIWMFLTPVTYPFYLVGGGLSGNPTNGGIMNPARYVHVLGHVFNLGSVFKLNPMTDGVLTFQAFIYNGAMPGSVHYVPLASPIPGHPPTLTAIPETVSWFGVGYFVAWAFVALAVGLWVFRKYEARLPEEL
jgi:ABC-type polysaccharide/polyol phosphate export permease